MDAPDPDEEAMEETQHKMSKEEEAEKAADFLYEPPFWRRYGFHSTPLPFFSHTAPTATSASFLSDVGFFSFSLTFFLPQIREYERRHLHDVWRIYLHLLRLREEEDSFPSS